METDEAEMRERQRQYLDFLDDDVSILFCLNFVLHIPFTVRFRCLLWSGQGHDEEGGGPSHCQRQ